MSDDALQKAIAAAGEAADDSQQLELMKTVLMAQTIAQAMQQQPQQPAPQPEFNAKKWVTIGSLGIAGALAASLFAVAVAIGAVSVAILALVLRSIWRDIQKHR